MDVDRSLEFYSRNGGQGEWALVDLATGIVGARWERRGHVLAFSRDGSVAFEVSALTGRLMNLRTGTSRAFLATPTGRAWAGVLPRAVARDLVISADGTRATAALTASGPYGMPGAALGSHVGAATWDLVTGELRDAWLIEPSRDGVSALSPSAGGGGLVARLSASCVEWNLSGANTAGLDSKEGTRAAGAAVRNLGDLGGGTVSTDGRYAASPGQSGGELVLRDLYSDEVVSGLSISGPLGRRDSARAIALWVSPDRLRALSAHVRTPDTLDTLGRSASRELPALWVLEWRLPEGKCAGAVELTKLPTSGAVAAFSPDGRRLAISCGVGTEVGVFGLVRPIASTTLDKLGAGVRCLCFSPDGRVVAAGCTDGSALLWEVGVHAPQARLTGHLEPVNGVCFTRDGRLATGSADGSIALWDTRQRLLRAAQGVLRGGLEGWPTTLVSRATDAARALTVGLLQWLPEPAAGRDPGQLRTAPLSAVLFCFRPPAEPQAIYRTREEEKAIAMLDPDWLVSIPQGCYDCSPGASSRVAWLMGDRVYPFDQFEEATRRPDVVRSVLAGQGIPRGAVLGFTHTPPQVDFRSPAYGETLSGDTVSVTLSARGAWPIERIGLFANGRPVAADVAAQLTAAAPVQGEASFTCEVPVPRSGDDLRLRAIAYDTSGLTSRPAELLLRGRAAGGLRGGLILLSIGISRYRNEAWNTINYADDDAIAIADALAAGSGAVKYRQVLTNEDAHTSAVKFALRNFKDMATEDDTAVVFIAGHGIQPRGDDYYFLCHDSTESDLPNTSLPWNDFAKLLAETRARRVVLFADTCHSGMVTGTGSADRAARLNAEGGVVVFTASRGDEASIESEEWQHGAFTHALLEGLKGQADHAPGSPVLPPEPKPEAGTEQEAIPATEATGPMPQGPGASEQPAPQPTGSPGAPGRGAPPGAPAAGTEDEGAAAEGTAPGVTTSPGANQTGSAADDEAGKEEPQPGDGVVTIAELGDYVAAKVIRLSQGRQHPIARLEQVSGDEPLVTASRGQGVSSLVFSPDRHTLLSTTSEGALWDLGQTPPVARRLQPADADPMREGLAGIFSPDGRWVATWGRTSLSWWDARTGVLCDRWPLHADAPRAAVCFSADSCVLLCSSGQLRYADLYSASAHRELVGGVAGATAQTLGGGPSRRTLRCVGLDRPALLSPTADGTAVLAADEIDADGRIQVAAAAVYTPLDPLRGLLSGLLGIDDQPPELPTPGPLQVSDPRPPWFRFISGDRLAYVHDEVLTNDGLRGQVVSIVELRSGERVARVPLLSRCTLMGISDDGSRLVTVSNGGLQVRETAKGSVLCRIPTNGASFTALALSPDGSVLATGDVNGAIELWDTTSGEHRLTVRAANRTDSDPGRTEAQPARQVPPPASFLP